MATGLSALPLGTVPMVEAGDDLAAVVGDALLREGFALADGDVLVIAQKIVSKAEGRTVALAGIEASPRAQEIGKAADKDSRLVELMLSEASEVMRIMPGVVITRHRHGHVLANAGIDASNVAGNDDVVLLWPVDPDRSARTLRAAIEARFAVRIAVIISDSLGRAWRIGTSGTAIGVAGMKPLRDRRGEDDLFGRKLRATVIGVADEIAAAASLVIGEGAEATPAAIIRGARYDASDTASVAEMLRPLDQDFFR